jgi:hypothetical protein
LGRRASAGADPAHAGTVGWHPRPSVKGSSYCLQKLSEMLQNNANAHATVGGRLERDLEAIA